MDFNNKRYLLAVILSVASLALIDGTYFAYDDVLFDISVNTIIPHV